MDEQESLDRAIHEPVRLVRYDPSWPERFQAERDRLLAVCPGGFLALEHFGSTAVPGLRSKPVIDILAGVESMAHAGALIPRLCAAGYTAPEEYNAALVDRRWLMRWANGRRTHHLSIVVHGSREWHRRLSFRDRLRSDAALARDYARLKASLAADHPEDRESYTAAKRAFIEQALRSGPGGSRAAASEN